MAILINDTSPRTQYTATASQTVFTIPFEFFSNADLVVYQNTTLKTLTTHYTATGAGVTGGGTLTLVTGATAGDIITIIRDIPVKRVTDFPTSGPFNVDALNSDLDRLTAMVREREDQVSRVISLAQTDAAVNLYLPIAAERASKVMAFDSTGNVITSQELGTYRGNWASGTAYVLRDIIKDTSNANIYICVSAHTSTGSQPISSNANSASWALLVDAATASSASSSASASASAASSSASAASSSASSASSSASSATLSASTATTQASNASTSATNAASSASAAATSETNAGNSATSASNSAALAAATVAGGLYSAVIDKSANYTVVLADAGDLIRVTTTSGAVTITLPQISTVTDGFKVAVVKWTSDSNAVTISRSGSDTINGATSASIGSQYTQTTFVADFETNQWFASTSGLGSTNVVIDTFNGTGSQTAFTLSGDAGTENNTYVYVSGVYQAKATYSLSGTTLTFSTAPPSGTGNVEVVWTQPLPVGTPSDGTVTPAKLSTGGPSWTSGGNLGIGTSSPSSKIDAYNSSTTSTVIRTRNDTTTVYLDANNAYAYLNTFTNHPLLFGTNNIERMRIDSSGNVGIGTSSPTYKLDIQSPSATFGLQSTTTTNLSYITLRNAGYNYVGVENSAGGGLFTSSSAYALVLGTVSAYPIQFGTSGIIRATIDSSGNVQVGGTTVANTVGYVNSRTNTRAWARWNGTNGVITSSYNVSSVTRNSTGDYAVAYTTALADANYAILTSGAGDTAYGGYGMYVQLKAAPTTTGCGIITRSNTGTYADQPSVQIAVFGN